MVLLQLYLKVETYFLNSIIEPIMLYGSEVWGPLTSQDLPKWEKHLLEALHADTVHRHTANNACRAELGQYPLIIKIQRRAIKFYKHLQSSDPHSYQYKALQCHELNKDQSPLCQLLLKLCPHTPKTIWLNQIISKQKDDIVCILNIKIKQIFKIK